jgi:Spy/CpxP family protein refolding chaperone
MKKATKWTTAIAASALTAALAVAGVTAAADGRGEHRNGEGRQERQQKLAETLNLTDAQKQQWDAIRKASREQNADFFAKSKETMDAFRAARDANDQAKMDALKPAVQAQRAQMKQIRDAEHQRILTVLTPDQRTQFEQLKAERETRHGHRGGDHQ